jgi:O-antigen/teichoic acid export membrane protein
MVYGLIFIFQASEIWELMLRIEHNFSVIARTHIFSSLCSSALKLISIFLGWPIICIVVSMSAEYAMNLRRLVLYRMRNRPAFVGKFQIEYARNLLKASSLVMLSGFLVALQSRSEYYLIDYFLGLEALGLYAAAFKSMEVIDVLVLVFTMTVMPELARRHHIEFSILARRIYLLGIIFFIATLVLMAFMYVIYPWVYGQQYLDAQAVIPWLAFRPLLIILGAIRGIFLVMEGRLIYMPVCSAVGLITTLIAGSFLIPFLGLVGAAISGLIGLVISNFVLDIFFKPQNLINILSCFREGPYIVRRILEMLKMRKVDVQ